VHLSLFRLLKISTVVRLGLHLSPACGSNRSGGLWGSLPQQAHTHVVDVIRRDDKVSPRRSQVPGEIEESAPRKARQVSTPPSALMVDMSGPWGYANRAAVIVTGIPVMRPFVVKPRRLCIGRPHRKYPGLDPHHLQSRAAGQLYTDLVGLGPVDINQSARVRQSPVCSRTIAVDTRSQVWPVRPAGRLSFVIRLDWVTRRPRRATPRPPQPQPSD
jgi:hypothetical protein